MGDTRMINNDLGALAEAQGHPLTPSHSSQAIKAVKKDLGALLGAQGSPATHHHHIKPPHPKHHM